MLRIDCLLINTEVAENAGRLIRYLGLKGLKEGKDVSFKGMYRELRDGGVEIDANTFGKIYSEQLPTDDARFTHPDDIKYDTGMWFDDLVRKLVLQPPKKGEKEIGDLSVAEAATKSFTDSFLNKVIADESTTSIMRQLQKITEDNLKRLAGPLPKETAPGQELPFDKLVQQAVDNLSKGYENKADGSINGLATIFNNVRNSIGELTQHMRNDGGHEQAEQWENYAKAIEDATFSLAFSTKEGKLVLDGALKEAGFSKTLKDGTVVKDWRKLTEGISGYASIKENVSEALAKKEFSPEVQEMVSNSMQKEYRDMRGELMEKADAENAKRAGTWDDVEAPSKNEKENLSDFIQRRIKAISNQDKLKKEILPDEVSKKTLFTNKEAQYILSQAIKAHADYGKGPADKRQIDWQELNSKKPDEALLNEIVQNYLSKDIGADNARLTADSMPKIYDQFKNDIDVHAERMLDTAEGALDRSDVERKSRLTRLAELNDLGIFKGSHDRLLNNILGLKDADRQTLDNIKSYADQLSKLRQVMSGKEFLAPTIQREIARDIGKIVSKNISNKSGLMKAISGVNQIYQVDNSMLISTRGGIMENHISGMLEYLTTAINMRGKLGKLATFADKDTRKLMSDMYLNIAAGGAEYGLAPYQAGGNQVRTSDYLTFRNLKKEDWKSAKGWGKGISTGIMAIPRTFLSGADGAFKVALFRLHTLGAIVDALQNNGLSHEEAINHVHEALQGPGALDKARTDAADLYQSIGRTYTSQKEINIAAHHLILENLLLNPIIGEKFTPKMLKETMDNSFHMAGLGMGHESNNFMSTFIRSGQKNMQEKEDEATKNGDYDKAARLRLGNTVVNSMLMRFAASRFNWATIRVQQGGGGLIESIYHYNEASKLKDRASKVKNDDILKSETIDRATHEYQMGRQKFYRGAAGLAVNGLAYGLVKGLSAFIDDDKDDYGNAVETDRMQKLYGYMTNNPEFKRIFIKVAPIWMLGNYQYNMDENGDAASKLAYGTLKTFSQITNAGDAYDVNVQIYEITKGLAGKNEYQRQQAFGKIGQLLGGYTPSVPLWREYSSMMRTYHYFKNGKQDQWPDKPTTISAGYFYGGVWQAVRDEFFPEDAGNGSSFEAPNPVQKPGL